MKNIIGLIACIVWSIACTPKTPPSDLPVPLPAAELTPKSADPLPEEIPAMNEPDLVKGIQLQFASSKKTGSSYNVTDLKIIEKKTGKVVDSFSEYVWGTVSVSTSDDVLTWLRFSEKGSEVTVTYSANESGDVVKSGKCHMYNDPNAHRLYLKALPKLDDKNAYWEKVVFELRQLATHGNLEAYEFFMAPSAQQKKYEKYNDGAASFDPTREVLTFMKSAGCEWKKSKRM